MPEYPYVHSSDNAANSYPHVQMYRTHENPDAPDSLGPLPSRLSTQSMMASGMTWGVGYADDSLRPPHLFTPASVITPYYTLSAALGSSSYPESSQRTHVPSPPPIPYADSVCYDNGQSSSRHLFTSPQHQHIASPSNLVGVDFAQASQNIFTGVSENYAHPGVFLPQHHSVVIKDEQDELESPGTFVYEVDTSFSPLIPSPPPVSLIGYAPHIRGSASSISHPMREMMGVFHIDPFAAARFSGSGHSPSWLSHEPLDHVTLVFRLCEDALQLIDDPDTPCIESTYNLDDAVAMDDDEYELGFGVSPPYSNSPIHEDPYAIGSNGLHYSAHSADLQRDYFSGSSTSSLSDWDADILHSSPITNSPTPAFEEESPSNLSVSAQFSSTYTRQIHTQQLGQTFGSAPSGHIVDLAPSSSEPSLLYPAERAYPAANSSLLAAAQKKCKMHECPVCHKQFPRPSGLATHMNSHSGARPFHCPFKSCNKSFAVRSNARRHLRTHGVIPPNSRPPPTDPVPYSVGFEPPVVSHMSTPAGSADTKMKLRWIPQSLADRTNVGRLRPVELPTDNSEQNMDEPESEDDDMDDGRDAEGESEDEEVLVAPLPAVNPSEPSSDPHAKYEERNSWGEAGTHPYHPSQWRALPGPAVVYAV